MAMHIMFVWMYAAETNPGNKLYEMMKLKIRLFQSQTKKRVASYIVVFVATGIFSKNQWSNFMLSLITTRTVTIMYTISMVITNVQYYSNLLSGKYYCAVDLIYRYNDNRTIIIMQISCYLCWLWAMKPNRWFLKDTLSTWDRLLRTLIHYWHYFIFR